MSEVEAGVAERPGAVESRRGTRRLARAPLLPPIKWVPLVDDGSGMSAPQPRGRPPGPAERARQAAEVMVGLLSRSHARQARVLPRRRSPRAPKSSEMQRPSHMKNRVND